MPVFGHWPHRIYPGHYFRTCGSLGVQEKSSACRKGNSVGRTDHRVFMPDPHHHRGGVNHQIFKIVLYILHRNRSRRPPANAERVTAAIFHYNENLNLFFIYDSLITSFQVFKKILFMERLLNQAKLNERRIISLKPAKTRQ